MPLPLNQNTKRLSMGLATPSAAYPVPMELNMLTSGGSPTCTAPPASVRPLRNLRRETRERLVMTDDTGCPSFATKIGCAYHRDYHFAKLKSGLLEAL